jgi:hypothetical protein
VSDDFVRDLEEELIAAARFRAARRGRRVRLPRITRRAVGGALLGAAALALIALLTALALTIGRNDDRAADERRATPPPSGVVVPLAPMQSAACRGLEVRDVPAAGSFPEIGLLARAQRADEQVDLPDEEGVAWLPVRTFDKRETRLPGYRRLEAGVRVIPSRGVALDGRCGSNDGEGLCLVDPASNFRCFTKSQVDGGGAVTRTPAGVIVGIVPDGVEAVTLTAGGKSTTAEVVENVYEVRLRIPAGTDVRVAPADRVAGCRRTVAPDLLDRVAVLRRPAEQGHVLPRAALDVMAEWRWQLDAVVEDRARFWGGGDGIEYWAVPIVPRSAHGCAPATGVCIVAVPEDTRADGQCNEGDALLRKGGWRLAPLLPGHAAIYGTVPDGVTGARVTIDGQTAEVDASDNVVGGRLPFPYRDTSKTSVVLLRGP